MSLRKQFEQAIGDAIKASPVGIQALTEGPQNLTDCSMENVARLRMAVLLLGDTIDAELRRAVADS